MDFINLLKIIFEELKLNTPYDLKNSLYLITINQKDELYILENDEKNGFCLYSFLFPAIPEYKSQLSSKINELNTYGQITKTAVVSLSKDDDSFILSEQFLYEHIQKDSFINRLKEFYSLVCYFKEQWPKWQLDIMTESKKNTLLPSKKQIISYRP